MGGSRGARADGEPPKRSAFVIAFRRALRDTVRMMDRAIDCGVRAFSVVMKVLGPCLVILALSLISFVAYTYFVYRLPQLQESIGIGGQVAVTAVGLFLVTNALYNYAKAVLGEPGLPPEWDKARAELDAEQEALGEEPPRQCKRCSRLKPARAHHCSVCRRCVLKMDHHCPWINNCVGHGNYRHFLLFMLFLAWSCIFSCLVFMGPFSESFFQVRRRRGSRTGRQYMITSFMISVSIFTALCMLGGFHTYLVLTNQTTIEFQTNMINRREAKRNGEYFRNPYDLGRSRNFRQVFGPNNFCRFLWLLPYLSEPPVGDGLVFQSLHSRPTCI